MIETAPSLETHTVYLNAGKTIDDVMASDVFRGKIDHGTSPTHALTASAETIAKNLLRGEHTLDDERKADVYTILSKLDDFTYGLEGLRHHHQVEPLDKRTVKASKLRVIEFNHAVQDMLAHDPTIEFDEIVSYLSDMHGVLNQHRWGNKHDEWHREASWFHGQLEATVRGMQQEIFGEQIALRVPGVTAVERSSDPEDELRGVDRWVTMDGVRFPVDFKASYAAARHAHEHTFHPEQIVYTGVEGPRFKKALRLNTQDIELRTEQMKVQLERARDTYLAHRRQQMGRAATLKEAA